VRVELGHVGILPVWATTPQRTGQRQTRTPVIHPVLIDREIPQLEARLNELNKIAGQSKAAAQNSSVEPNKQPLKLRRPQSRPPRTALTDEQKKEFIELTTV